MTQLRTLLLPFHRAGSTKTLPQTRHCTEAYYTSTLVQERTSISYVAKALQDEGAELLHDGQGSRAQLNISHFQNKVLIG